MLLVRDTFLAMLLEHLGIQGIRGVVDIWQRQMAQTDCQSSALQRRKGLSVPMSLQLPVQMGCHNRFAITEVQRHQPSSESVKYPPTKVAGNLLRVLTGFLSVYR